MAPTKKKPASKKPRGRPKGAEPPPPVTGVRIPLDVLEALDAIVERRAATLAAQGATTSRNALIVAMLRDAIAREASS